MCQPTLWLLKSSTLHIEYHFWTAPNSFLDKGDQKMDHVHLFARNNSNIREDCLSTVAEVLNLLLCHQWKKNVLLVPFAKDLAEDQSTLELICSLRPCSDKVVL